MDCLVCGNAMDQIRSVTLKSEPGKNDDRTFKPEVIVYEQCLAEGCSNRDEIDIVDIHEGER